MFGFQTAEIGKTVHLNSNFPGFLRIRNGKITNVSRNEDGKVEVIYASVDGHSVSVKSDCVLTVI